MVKLKATDRTGQVLLLSGSRIRFLSTLCAGTFTASRSVRVSLGWDKTVLAISHYIQLNGLEMSVNA